LEAAFLGCWFSVVMSAASVYASGELRIGRALALSFNAGAWTGAVIAVAGTAFDFVEALPCILAVLIAATKVRRRLPIATKVVATWLIAISLLAATLPFLPVTPGYVSDHME
jgi:hypothetical protein